MNNSLNWVNEQKIKRTIEALNRNNMTGYFLDTKDEVVEKVKSLIKEGDIITCGGSMSLFETGIIELLKDKKYKYLDRYEEGLTREELQSIYRQAFTADCYLTSSNAVTENGELYNVDGNGNRVAAMLFGPKKVIIIVGVNKIVPNVEEAIKRNRNIAAPANAKRLNRQTPCAKTGVCMDCNSKERICNEYTLIKRQLDEGRIHVLIVNEEIGY